MPKLSHEEKVALYERIAKRDERKNDGIEESRSMIVVKSNALIQQARYELSLQEQRILLYLISKIKPDDTEIKETEISIIDFCKVCGIDYTKNKATYSYVKSILKNLADKSNWIEFEPDTETLVRWIDTLSIHKGSGSVKISLSRNLAPYLIGLRKQYTQIPLFNILPMKSKYGIRLYEILKSYANLGSKRISIDELKKRLNAESYKDTSNFKKKVLFPALKDIEEYGDIKVSTIFIKTKNKITHIEFVITLIDDINEKISRWDDIENALGK